MIGLTNAHMSYVSGGQPVTGITITGSMFGTHGIDCQGVDMTTFTISESSSPPSFCCTAVQTFGSTNLFFVPNGQGQTTGVTGAFALIQQAPAPKLPDSSAAAINQAAVAQNGKSDKAFMGGTSCLEGCVLTVNNLVHQATGYWMGSSAMNNVDVLRKSGAIVPVAKADTVPGNLIIVDSVDNVNGHIGICLSNGCDTMNSNSSHPCTFTFSNLNFDYPGSPYHNGIISYWKVI